MQQRITINLNTDSKTTDKTTILEYCRSHGIAGIETPCGGKGTCGKCKVTVTKPYYKDVLACQTKICDGMEIIVGRKESTGTKEDSMVVLTNGENVSEIYEYLCDEYWLEPEESVFIDDRPVNIKGAETCGIHGIVFRSYEQAKKELDEFLKEF